MNGGSNAGPAASSAPAEVASAANGPCVDDASCDEERAREGWMDERTESVSEEREERWTDGGGPSRAALRVKNVAPRHNGRRLIFVHFSRCL